MAIPRCNGLERSRARDRLASRFNKSALWERGLPTEYPDGSLMAIFNISDFSSNFSLVAKRPSPAHVTEVSSLLPRGVQIYLSTDPHSPPDLLREGSQKLVASGLRPVPHLAVRMFADCRAVDAFVQGLADTGVNELFVIAGDIERPKGVLKCSLELVASSLLLKHGVVEVGVAGYPEGHPEVPVKTLEESLFRKI